MATFAAHVVVHGDAGSVQFSPGDDVPDWAVGLVGDHVLTSEPEAPAEDDLDGDDADPDAESVVDDEDADEVAADDEAEPSSAAPDFTAAAHRRRTSRK